MFTLAYTCSLILFVLLSVAGCTLPAILAAAVFLGLLGRVLVRDLHRHARRPTVRG